MSVSLWAYKEGICDGGGCVGDCDLCNLPFIMEDEDGEIDIKNLPRVHRKYIVARKIPNMKGSGEYWFWGSWDNEKEAYTASESVGGQVFIREKEDE